MIFMDTPTYEGTIVVGGKDQNTISSIATILPEILINKQSGKLILTFVDDAGDPFSLLSITSLDAFAKPFESAEVEVNMGTGAISGAGDNVYTVSWVRDKFPAGWSTFSEDRDGTISFMVRLQETGTEDYYQWSTRFNIQDSELAGNSSVLPDLSLVFYYNPIYIYDNNTTAADPGAGKFRFNNTTLSSVTEMYAADKNESNVDLQTYWQSLGIGSIIYFGNPNVKLEGAFFEVSGGVTDNTGFSTVPLTFVSAGTSQFTSGSSFSLTIDMIASVEYADGESINDNNANELLTFGVVDSAVNNIKTTNAATGTDPQIEAIGDDANPNIILHGKGTGKFGLADGADNTKRVLFDVSGITTATDRTITVPDTNIDLADIALNTAKPTQTEVASGVDNNQTGTTYTLVLTDADNKTVWLNNAASIAVTIPTNASVAFPVGTKINLMMEGAGVPTTTGDTGVTVNGVSAGSFVINNQNQGATITKRATNTWIASGDIT